MDFRFSLGKRKLLKRVEHFEAQLRQQPEDPQLWLRHAEAAWATKDLPKALSSLRHAASLYRGAGSWARAAAVLKRAIELAPDAQGLKNELQEVSARRTPTPCPSPLALAEERTELFIVTHELPDLRDEAANTDDETGGFSLAEGFPTGFAQDLPEAISSEMILPGPAPAPTPSFAEEPAGTVYLSSPLVGSESEVPTRVVPPIPQSLIDQSSAPSEPSAQPHRSPGAARGKIITVKRRVG
ncbi:MAG: tetratricopeptide repeat protein [Myxococcaceae bacterium]